VAGIWFYVEEPLDEPSILEGGLHDLGHVIGCHPCVEYAIRLYGDEGAYLAEALAAALRHKNAGFLLAQLDNGVEPRCPH
jgi:hypothetical protein